MLPLPLLHSKLADLDALNRLNTVGKHDLPANMNSETLKSILINT